FLYISLPLLFFARYLFSLRSVPHRVLHSFPTRRSSDLGVCPHATCAFDAASTAKSTSSCVDRATSQNTFPVTGLMFSKYFPFAGGTYSPPIKLSYRSAKLTSEPFVLGFS